MRVDVSARFAPEARRPRSAARALASAATGVLFFALLLSLCVSLDPAALTASASASGAPIGAATPANPSTGGPEERFRQAGGFIRSGEFPRAIGIYESLASTGSESSALYWNWAQAALARGGVGEALWALLRAREVEPQDRAIGREIERLREVANLDAAEISPETLGGVGRTSRRLHLDVAALGLLVLSLLFHGMARLVDGRVWPGRAAWGAFLLGTIVAVAPVAAAFARPTGVVVRRGAPLSDSASPTAEATGSLREGEVVPILNRSGDYLRVEDSSGARGWAHVTDVRRLDRPPNR